MNELYTFNRTLNVPGPLKCINSYPTMEGRLHGDVRGVWPGSQQADLLELLVPALTCIQHVCVHT